MNIFTKHPHSVNETYFEHMLFALKFGARLMGGGLACMIHGICPFLFEKTGSTTVLDAVESFITRAKSSDPNDKVLVELIRVKQSRDREGAEL